jgi:epsilon-lactone hydrolase
MTSKQSLANKVHYETMAKDTEPKTPDEMREYNDTHWTGLTAEPRGVDYVETDAGGIPAMWIEPKGAAKGPVIFYAHGGGFVGGSIYTHRKLVGHLAKAAGCRALIYDYPYAHQAKYPAPLNAAMTAYRWLLDQGAHPNQIILAGDSCGAMLSLGVLQRSRDEGLAIPAGVMTISGWYDAAVTNASFEMNREKDIFFNKAVVEYLAQNFLGDGDPRDPQASPLYADPTGFPPIYLQAGADETLVGENESFADRATRAGVEVKLDVFPDMLHSFQMMAGRAPEADDAVSRLGAWARSKLGLQETSKKVA